MATSGDLAYCLVLAGGRPKPISGWVVESAQEEVVIATSAGTLQDIPNKRETEAGDLQIGFVRVPVESVSLSAPSDWKGIRPVDLPPFSACERAWKKAGKDELASSEAEAPKAATRKKGPKSLVEDLQDLRALYRGAGDSDEDETEDDGGELPFKKSGFLPPGGKPAKGSKETGERGARKAKEDEIDLNKMIKKGIEAGQSPSEMMPMMMMMMLMNQQKPKGSRRGKASGSILGGSDSETSGSDDDFRGKGMKAVAQLHKLQEQIKRRPRRICEQFEKEVVEELGVVKGAQWTLRDYVRKQQWGKFKGIYRCAMMDVAVYESLRAGDSEVAAAQVVQNLKAKLQSVLQGGDWSAAWLLTGLPDPLARREFGGSKEEMSIISGYVEALHKLQKRVRESQSRGHADEEGDEQPSSSSKK